MHAFRQLNDQEMAQTEGGAVGLIAIVAGVLGALHAIFNFLVPFAAKQFSAGNFGDFGGGSSSSSAFSPRIEFLE